MNLPTIPDNLYKILILIGTFLIGYFYFYRLEPLQIEIKKSDKYFTSKLDSLNDKVKIYESESKKITSSLKNIGLKLDNLMKKLPQKDVLSEEEYSNYNSIFSKIELLQNDHSSIGQKLLNNYNTQIAIRGQMVLLAKNNLEKQDQNNNEKILYEIFIFIGLFAFILGFIGLINHQLIQDEIIKRQLSEKEVYYSHCQSCGKKFNSIIQHSKNNDGTKNNAFCISCWSNDQFSEPNLMLNELIEHTKTNKIFKHNWIYKTHIISRLKNLERWKENPYD